MVRLHYISAIIATLISLLLTSCDATIHFYPEAEEEPDMPKYDVELELQYFDLDMPIHTIIDNIDSRATSEPQHIGRHIIRIFDSDLNVIDEIIVTDDAENATNKHSHHFQLYPGAYTAICWTDYTLDENDNHYDTSDISNLELKYNKAEDGFLMHIANTPWRDAFCGRIEFTVTQDGAKEVIEMRRPLARFIFEATDLSEFIEKQENNLQSDDDLMDVISNYKIFFRYDGFVPSKFSILNDAPSDSRIGASFLGEPKPSSFGEKRIELGSDFVFVHPTETFVNIAIEIRNAASDEVAARAGPFKIPLIRNKLTIVRGKFLTSNSTLGIEINIGFDGDFNIEIR